MQHTISNDFLSISVLQKGAEICSIKSKYSGLEYMWGADSAIWGSHAPVLFPAIGAIKNKEAMINGKVYNVPRHGFIRHNESLHLKNSSPNELLFQLDYSEETLSVYPYKFSFQIGFRLENHTLTVSHKVINLDDQDIFFCLGGHPAFNCPMHKHEQYEDYFLEFEEAEHASTTKLSVDGLITNRTEPIIQNSKVLNLKTDLFDQDALIFKDLKSSKISLKSTKSDQSLTLDYRDFAYLGIWAKPDAPFVCIEPWNGMADHENTDGDFTQKEGIVSVGAHENFRAAYSITIDE